MADYHSIAGKKGQEKSRPQQMIRTNIFAGMYMLFPKVCKACGKDIPFNMRRNDYCSHRCHGKTKITHGLESKFNLRHCIICGKEMKRHSKIVCSQKCDFVNRAIHKYINGKETQQITKSLLIYYFGYSCNICGISEWNNKKLTLEAHHTDGDANNNSIANMLLLCPNCHSQTDNFKSKNKNCTRKSRNKASVP